MLVPTIELLSMHLDNCQCMHKLSKRHTLTLICLKVAVHTKDFIQFFFHTLNYSKSCHSSCHSSSFFYRGKATLVWFCLPFFYKFCSLISLCHHPYPEHWKVKVISCMVGSVLFTFSILTLRHLMWGSPDKMQLYTGQTSCQNSICIILSHDSFCFRADI